MIDLRTPTGKDIAKLFELCAPEPLLENLGIDEYDDEPYFIDIFDLMDEFLQIKVTAMALYFSNRTLANYEKTKSIVKNLYISPEIIHSLIEFTGVEGYKEIEAIFSSIRNEEMRHPSKIKHEITKNKWSPIIADFYKMMSQKPNGPAILILA